MRIVLLALAATTLLACATATDGVEETDDALTVGGVAALVQQRLDVRHPSERNRTWTITQGNAIPDDGILAMPALDAWGARSLAAPPACSGARCAPDFGLRTCAADADCGGARCVALEATKAADDAPAAQVCAGHSDAILDEIRGVMTSAHHRLDVTSLAPPTGRFLATMRNAVTTLDRRGEAVVVRFLFASYFNTKFDPASVLADLTRDVSRSTRLVVSVASHTGGLTTWNHSKIIAADGNEAIVGGMNLVDEHYLEAAPVHDVSLHVKGPVVTTMQTFANDLWSTACRSQNDVATLGRGGACPAAFVPGAVSAAGNVQMIGVGRGGTSRDATITALVAMMDASRRSLRITQQDIGSLKLPGGTLVTDYVDAWIRAARRGVNIQIVLSNDGARGGSGTTDADSYSNGWSREELWRGIDRRADEIWPDAHARLCKNLHISTLRNAGKTTWADGRPLANHAKVLIADDFAYYVGSQNMYAANLAEYGVIVDSPAETKRFAATFWEKVAATSTEEPYVDASCR